MMRYSHLEVLVEERSMYVALENLIPKIIGNISLKFHVFDGKHALLRSVETRMRGYASMFKSWNDAAIVVLLDEDRADCKPLKLNFERAAEVSGLGTLSVPRHGSVRVLNRIVVEELEAWFLGDPDAIVAAYPRVKRRAFPQSALRDPDTVGGGTWEALERLLNKHDYHIGGLRKIECAAAISAQMDVTRNSSRSFKQFCRGLELLVRGGDH
jgi:hypothetical protein